MRLADAIFVSEEHDDGEAHRLEHLFFSELIALEPRACLLLEMLARDSQEDIDLYLGNEISEQSFIDRIVQDGGATSALWKGYFQPLLRLARTARARVIAPNAPYRFIRLARERGESALDDLPEADKALFRLAIGEVSTDLRERFKREVLASRSHADSIVRSESALDRSFRASLIWDATMADSAAEALNSGCTKVFLVLGNFHADYEGPTVTFFQELTPRSKVVTISLRPGTVSAIKPQDRNRADFVVYTSTEYDTTEVPKS
jgi:uncharacterized iron-regulated protein